MVNVPTVVVCIQNGLIVHVFSDSKILTFITENTDSAKEVPMVTIWPNQPTDDAQEKELIAMCHKHFEEEVKKTMDEYEQKH